MEDIDAEGDCFGCGCFTAEDKVITVEELSGLDVIGDNTAVALVPESADVKRETVLLGTLGGAVP